MPADTEIIDRLFLELSQFTRAKTHQELDLERRLRRAYAALKAGTRAFAEPATGPEIKRWINEFEDVISAAIQEADDARPD